ncbi:MAG: Xaa-Pro peptidase family protein [Thermodesulfobacteriota bacterium]
MYSYRMPPFHQPTPAEEISARVRRFQAALDRKSLDAGLIVFPTDLFYFSGTMQSAHLLVPARGEPLLMARRDLSRVRAETSLADVVPLPGFRALPELVAARLGGGPRSLGLELDVLPVARFERYRELWPRTRFLDVSPDILAQRAVKSEYELGLMRRAGDLAHRVYGRIPGLMKEGQTEIELAGLITSVAYAGGHQNFLRTRAFDRVTHSWHVIGGESGGILSYIEAPFGGYGLSPAFPVGASQKVLRSGEAVLVDFGVCLGGYQVDLTRMFALGRPPERLLEAYQALGRIEAALLARLRPGATGDELYGLAVTTAGDLGFADAFLGPPGHQVRFVGHGVGLEIDEPPVLAAGLREPLEAGMTVALELKMVFPGLGAAGLENTVLVGPGGPEILTPAEDGFIMV